MDQQDPQSIRGAAAKPVEIEFAYGPGIVILKKGGVDAAEIKSWSQLTFLSLSAVVNAGKNHLMQCVSFRMRYAFVVSLIA